MNKLKKYAGLLNDAAPKGEFLAYINDDEAKMLKAAGGSGLLTPQGIPSYRTAYAGEQYSGGSKSKSSSSGGDWSPGAGSPGTTSTGGNVNTGGRDPTQQFSNTPPPSQMAKETLAKQRETSRKQNV